MKKVNLLVFAMLATMSVHAEVSDYLPEAKLAQATNDLKKIYVGVGVTQKLLHANAEWVNPYGIAYAKVGAFMHDDYDPGVQAGFRLPVHFTGTDQNGYYLGVYAGHQESAMLDGESVQRLGVGVDFSYVLLDKQRISTLSVGIGAGEKLKGQYGTEWKSSPKLVFAYSLSFGAF